MNIILAFIHRNRCSFPEIPANLRRLSTEFAILRQIPANPALFMFFSAP